MQALREAGRGKAQPQASPPSGNKYPPRQPQNGYGPPETAGGAAYTRPLPAPPGGASGGYTSGQAPLQSQPLVAEEADDDPRSIASRRNGYAPAGGRAVTMGGPAPYSGSSSGRVYAPAPNNGA
jgi:hypothetical protein